MLPSEQNEPLFGSEFETDFTLFNKIRLKHFSALLGRRKTFFCRFSRGLLPCLLAARPSDGENI
jgi:hypothetical protein